MSLLWSLRRYVDSIEHRRQEADRRTKREVRPAEPNGDGGADGERARVEKARVVDGVCRVCGYEGDARGYCPTCLAETMAAK